VQPHASEQLTIGQIQGIYQSWAVHICRDRATKNTENAIQLAHEENHSAKATEVVLSHAKESGVEFCTDLPLVPTLQEVKVYLSTKGHCGVDAALAPRSVRGRGKITDSPQRGERTFFMGKGKRLGVATQDGEDVRNAIGFFMYTRCQQNTRGEWPAVLGTAPHSQDSHCIHD
jgi:hypothetical protein